MSFLQSKIINTTLHGDKSAGRNTDRIALGKWYLLLVPGQCLPILVDYSLVLTEAPVSEDSVLTDGEPVPDDMKRQFLTESTYSGCPPRSDRRVGYPDCSHSFSMVDLDSVFKSSFLDYIDLGPGVNHQLNATFEVVGLRAYRRRMSVHCLLDPGDGWTCRVVSVERLSARAVGPAIVWLEPPGAFPWIRDWLRSLLTRRSSQSYFICPGALQ